MSKGRKARTTCTLDKELKTMAEERGIILSHALEVGLKYLLEIEDPNIDNEKVAMKREELRKKEESKKYGKLLRKNMAELMRNYNYFMEANQDPYMDGNFKDDMELKGAILDLEIRDIRWLCDSLYMGELNLEELRELTREKLVELLN